MPLLAAKVRDDLEYFDEDGDEDQMVVVRDPVRGNYFRFNVLQIGMLRALDGVRTPAQIAEQLSQEFDVEVPAAAAERFVARARELMLLDVASYRVADEKARKQLARALRRGRFRLRSVVDEEAVGRVASSESALFMAAVRQLERREPIRAAEYLTAVLELNPGNRRARELHALIQRAFVSATSEGTGFPSFRLFNPSRPLGWLSRKIGPFLFSPWGLLLIAAYVAFGIYCLSIIPFGDLEISAQAIAIAFIESRFAILFHELGHGLACVYYGGRVTEVGVILFYYVSLGAYCDTSSSYLFKSRRHKVVVQLAGSVASMIYQSTQAIVLSVLNPDVPIYHGLLLGLIVGLTLAFITLIPFVKNDGYYAICDYFEQPNLRERSFRVTSAVLQRRLLGLQVEAEELPPRTRRWFIAFAVASFLFTTAFIYFGVFRLFAPVIEWQAGWGLVAVILFVIFLLRRFLFRPLAALARIVKKEWRTIFTVRRSAILVGLCALLVAPWMIRWPVLVDAEFVLAPAERVYVRAQTPGIVEQIFVQEGERVRRGQAIARLRNDQLTTRRRRLEKELEMAAARVTQLRSGARSEEIALAQRRLARAAGSYAKSASDAELKRKLANDRLGLGSDADAATRQARVDGAMASAASAQLELLRAGALPEEIAAAEAQRSSLEAQLQLARLEEERLTLRSPIDGVIATPRVHERLLSHLGSGSTLTEVHDDSRFVAELLLPPWAPLSQVRREAPIALRAFGAPHDDVEGRLARVRDVVASDQVERESIYSDSQVVAVSAPLSLPDGRSGMRGRGRIYGESRSLAYAHLYLPLKRLFSIRLWSIW